MGVTAPAFNSVYVTGTAKSWDFPWRDNLQPFNGSSDAFVAKLDPSAGGTASLIYATPLGGTALPGITVTAAGAGIAADPFGDIYIAGQTTADFPTAVTTSGTMNGVQPICASCQEFPAATDAFVVALQEIQAQQPSLYFNIGSVVFPAEPAGTQETPQPVAVHNGGEAPLSISSLQITGPNASDFSLVGPGACKGQVIPAGGQCSFEVGFIPSTTGPEQAVVSFSDNAPGNPQVLELIGAGQGAFALLSTTSLNFGSLPENTTSLSATITITNTGNQALAMQSPSESGPDVAQFFLNGKDISCGASLAPGASCQIGVVFSPRAIGTFHAQINITDNSGGVVNATQVVSLTGMGTPPAPVATVTPTALAFGDLVAGTTAGVQSVTIANTGSTALNFAGIGISGVNAQDFAVVTSGASPCPTVGGSLTVGTSCTLGIRFNPAGAESAGAKSASVSITDNASGSPQLVALSGGVTVAPTIQVTPSSLNFSAQSEGISSAPQMVTLLNTSAGSLAINTISVAGINAADFTETNNCPPSVRAGASCTVNVTFAPSARASASRSALLNISDNAAGSPQTVALSGTATIAGVSVSPASINFGGQLAGTASAAQTVMVTNNGTGALAFSAVSVTDAADFALGVDTCKGSSTPAGGTCTIQLTFNPACTNGAATRSGAVSLADNSPGSPQSVALTGTATGDFCFGSLASATVTAGQTAVYSLVVNSASGYKGSVTLACAGAPNTAACTAPATVTVPSQFSVSVATTANSSGLPLRRIFQEGPRPARWQVFVVILAALALGLAIPVRRFSGERQRQVGRFEVAFRVAALFLAVSVGIAACAGGGGTSAGADPPGGTPPGTYVLTLTGTTANTTSKASLSLVVQ
jgi:hypothetical protein